MSLSTRIAPAPRSHARCAPRRQPRVTRQPPGATLLLTLVLVLVALAALALLAVPDIGLVSG